MVSRKIESTLCSLFVVYYPKGTSKNFNAEINRDTIAAYARSVALQPVAMVAIEADWSALRLKGV
ncbi:MAG: hypothetical protein M1132_04355 [Chloroflexi bacterium]|nr:hypothetical protein [Chloroflexota bacterium]